MTHKALHQYLARVRAEPFRWGYHDCCMFAANLYRDVYRIDLAKGIRGKYRSPDGAERVIAEHGGLWKLINDRTKAAGMVRVSPLQAQTGAIVLNKWKPTGWTVGIFDGRQALFISAGGLRGIPISHTRHAFQLCHS